MRLHVLGLPQVGTTREYYLCGFVPKIILFCRMMKELGHTVILYTSEENTAPCDEAVVVITKKEQRKFLGKTPYVFAAFDLKYDMWGVTNSRMIAEIGKRKQSHDFICTVGGDCQKPVADAHPDLMTVEIGVGYAGAFSKYVVYESHSWRQYCYGKNNTEDGRFFDTVIPNYFDVNDFPFEEKKYGFLLYAGRNTPRKGIEIAKETAKLSGLPLKLIGPGYNQGFPSYCEHLGEVSIAERAKLMGMARAVIVPTLYNEPFGSVVVEANLCGTPVITTDYGSFPELVENGVNGFRCNLLREFVQAVQDTKGMDSAKIRDRAISRYSLDAIKPLYAIYFGRLMTLWDRGWYAE